MVSMQRELGKQISLSSSFFGVDNKVTCHKLNMFTVGVAVLSYFFCGRL